jgi:hypothetical protein
MKGGFLLGLPFHPEYRGNILLRNVGLSPNYAVLQYRIPHYSCNNALNVTDITLTTDVKNYSLLFVRPNRYFKLKTP